MASELEDVIVVNATQNYHELSREELDVPCSVDHCRELAKKQCDLIWSILDLYG